VLLEIVVPWIGCLLMGEKEKQSNELVWVLHEAAFQLQSVKRQYLNLPFGFCCGAILEL
jgi:hypothetical protein